jgi:hypothetical protein
VQKVIPRVVHVGDDEKQTLSLNYAEFIPYLTKALQETNAELAKVKARLAALESK